MSEEKEVDARESVFPLWYDLSIKIHGYETKGAFGSIHVLNSHDSQKSVVIKLLKPLREPNVEDEFVCESVDKVEGEEEEFDLVKGKKNSTNSF